MIEKLAIGITLLAASITTAVAEPSAVHFCSRLAPMMNLRPVLPKPPKKDVQEWRANQVGGLGGFLFGGTATVSFSVSPGEPTTIDSIQSARKMCQMTVKGVLCDLTGPVTLVVGTKRGNIEAAMLANERHAPRAAMR